MSFQSLSELAPTSVSLPIVRQSSIRLRIPRDDKAEVRPEQYVTWMTCVTAAGVEIGQHFASKDGLTHGS